MAEDESDSSDQSWKEKWNSLSERGSLLTKDVGKILSEQGKRISEASMDAASAFASSRAAKSAAAASSASAFFCINSFSWWLFSVELFIHVLMCMCFLFG